MKKCGTDNKMDGEKKMKIHLLMLKIIFYQNQQRVFHPFNKLTNKRRHADH